MTEPNFGALPDVEQDEFDEPILSMLGPWDEHPCETCGPAYEELTVERNGGELDRPEYVISITIGCFGGESLLARTEAEALEMAEHLGRTYWGDEFWDKNCRPQ